VSSVSSAYRVHDHETHRSVSAGSLPGDFAGHAAGWARRIKDKIRWLGFILSYARGRRVAAFSTLSPLACFQARGLESSSDHGSASVEQWMGGNAKSESGTL